MQNKANLLDAQMNVKSFHAVDYENNSNWTLGENKPNQSQFQTPANPPKEREETNRSGRLLFDPMLPLYPVRKPAFWKGMIFSTNLRNVGGFNTPSEFSNGVYRPRNDRYYSRRKCRCSSTVEHSFRKAGVVGPNPTIGCVNLQEKYNSLRQIIKGLGKVVIAYSGGVDSTFLLKAAVDTLGAENVLACIAKGPALPQSQYAQAIETAKNIGADVQTVEPNELADAAYSANKADRCFHCKTHLYGILNNIAQENNFNCVISGSNLDDKNDFRPGNRAAGVFGVRSPLMEAELTKEDIRQLSRQLNLPTADIPASPCLASRISYGLEVTEHRLKQIEEAEEFLKTLGLVEFRVRHHGTVARIEVNPQDIDKVTAEPARSVIVEKLKSLGFKFITVDLQGFRSGSLNEPLSEEEKRKML